MLCQTGCSEKNTMPQFIGVCSAMLAACFRLKLVNGEKNTEQIKPVHGKQHISSGKINQLVYLWQASKTPRRETRSMMRRECGVISTDSNCVLQIKMNL